MGRTFDDTERLMEKIADAMMEMLKDAPLDQIKITDVTKRAKVGRVSYFRHFDSKEGVLAFKASRLWCDWQESNPCPRRAENRDTAELEWFLSFLLTDDMRQMLSTMYRRLSPAELLAVFLKAGYPGLVPLRAAPQYDTLFFTYGIFGVLLEWIRNDFDEPPAELVRRYQAYAVRRPPAAVSFAPESAARKVI